MGWKTSGNRRGGGQSLSKGSSYRSQMSDAKVKGTVHRRDTGVTRMYGGYAPPWKLDQSWPFDSNGNYINPGDRGRKP